MAEGLLKYLKKRFPNENERLERLFQDFKKTLDEFSDSNDEELIRAADQAEAAYNRKRKLTSKEESEKAKLKKAEYKCDICDKAYTRKKQSESPYSNTLDDVSLFKMQQIFDSSGKLKKTC